MRLDVTNLRYLSDDDFRVLTAVEMGMKNHDLVPTSLIQTIANTSSHASRMHSTTKSLRSVHRNKLVHHEQKPYDGYRLTSLGYDFLALRALSKRGVVTHVGRQIGVGKEADIYLVEDEEGHVKAMKIHRLGRTSFRAVKSKRDYLLHRKAASWIYLSRLAAIKEFAFINALYDRGFPVPKPYDSNRHVIVMEYIPGCNLYHIKEMGHPLPALVKLIQVAKDLALSGLVHCDLNEFNILVNEETEVVYVIDFPQMISTSHENAAFFFNRDVEGLISFFRFRFKTELPKENLAGLDFQSLIQEKEIDLDVELSASGFDKDAEIALQNALLYSREEDYEQEQGSASDEPSDDDNKDNAPEEENGQKEDAHTDTDEDENGDDPAEENPLVENGIESKLKKTNLEDDERDSLHEEKNNERDLDDQSSDNERDVGKQGGTCVRHVPNSEQIKRAVKKQRIKQQRKAANKRNVVKDGEKRRLKNEMKDDFWG